MPSPRRAYNLKITYMVYSLLVEGLLSRKINVQQHLPSILHEIDNDLILPNKIEKGPQSTTGS
jgi:hypothetical protein